jgi:sigma-B regulation protein RsbU (phosphoserine phosphatase)
MGEVLVDSDALFGGVAVQPHRLTVLLVDDQAMIGEAVRRMLAAVPDLDYHFCADSTAALERAREVRPTVILLDLVMPDLDGLTLLKFLRADPATREVPIIVLSTKEEPKTKAEAFALGANDYLVKLPDPIELIARVRHHSGGYIAQLERNEAFAALERSQRALARELAQAAAYVRSLLPAPVSDAAITADWRFIPSVQLGGDAFGYHWLDEDRLVLFLLDVSGHGVKSALLSMTAMNAVRTRTLPSVDFLNPAHVLAALNEAFQMDLYDGMYFTIWYGVFDRRSRLLQYSSAGHPPALLVTRKDGRTVVDRLGEPGFTIGMVPAVSFDNEETVVPVGSNLFVFSDGAYEITRPDESMWSLDDFIATLEASDPGSGLLPLDQVEARIREVRGVEQFEDDVSLLEVRFSEEV